MAKAKKLTPEKPDVQLTLSWREAEVLRHLVRRVAGCTRTSARHHADSIGEALNAAGVPAVPIKTSASVCTIFYEDDTL